MQRPLVNFVRPGFVYDLGDFCVGTMVSGAELPDTYVTPRACCNSQRPSGDFRIGIGGFPIPGVISPSGALELTMGVIAHLAGGNSPASTTSIDF